MARETCIADAKQMALGLARAGYRPPPPRAHPRHGRDRPGDAAHGAAQPRRARTRSPRTTRRSAATSRASSRAARCPRARPSASSTSSTSSARRSSRCAGNRRPATASNTCSEEQASAELRGTDHARRRHPVGRADRHRARAARRRSRTPAPTTWRALVSREALRRAEVEPAAIEDVVLGCAQPEAEQGLNVARQVGLLAGLPDERAGDDHQPLLLVGPAGDRDRRRPHRGRRHRRRAGRRPRVDVDDPDGRREDRAQPGGRRAVPRRLHPDGQHRRERRAPVRRQPRRSGRVRARAATRRRSRRGRAATSRPRSCR